MRWVGFVRNVMLGRDGLDRARLLDAVSRCGGGGGRSYLTTGNVTFDLGPDDAEAFGQRLEAELTRIVARDTMVAIRPHDWLRELVSLDLFAGVDAGEWECEVAFLRHTAAPLQPDGIPERRRTRLVATFDRELASARPRSGRARPHVTRLLEQASAQPATARGWNTLCRIAADP